MIAYIFISLLPSVVFSVTVICFKDILTLFDPTFRHFFVYSGSFAYASRCIIWEKVLHDSSSNRFHFKKMSSSSTLERRKKWSCFDEHKNRVCLHGESPWEVFVLITLRTCSFEWCMEYVIKIGVRLGE